MKLEPGSRVGPYEVVEKLGEGGMGVVWRARDPRLERDVALKVLPPEVAGDPERLARFEREAMVVAQLSHPNIAGIHGLEAEGDTRALVLELAPGPTLEERMSKGRLELHDALEIARQIAAALEEAHERGIVHRDLKPQNVKAPVDGKVKVLDFGLAKAIEPDAETPVASASHSPTFMNSPTLTATGTQLGVILGTASYMAPEQARGVPIDKRADIWSFGVVLFEMLAGRRLFEGELVTDVLAGVLRQEIDFAELPDGTPPAIKRLLKRCLERRARNRLRDIGDARLVIDEVLEGDTEGGAAESAEEGSTKSPKPSLVALLIVSGAAIVAALAGTAGWLVGRANAPAPPSASETRLVLSLPAGDSLSTGEQPSVAISRDGRRHVVVVRGPDGVDRLLMRDLSVLEPWVLADTEGAFSPFFSPDGEWVAFFAADGLVKISVDGGTRRQLAEAPPNARGGTWSTDGYIYFSPSTGTALQRVPESGGQVVEVVSIDADRGERTHRWPSVLPDGSAVIFTADTIDSPEYYDDARIDAVRVATGERVTLIEGASQARFLPPDRLVFGRGGNLYVVPIDPRTLEIRGEEYLVQSEVATDVPSGAVHFDVASGGALVWIPGSAEKPLRRIERFSATLEPLPDFLEPGSYEQISLSPDGRSLAVAIKGAAQDDLWIADVERGTMTRRTFSGQVSDPVWTPDGRRIAVAIQPSSDRDHQDGIYWMTAYGGEDPDLLLASPTSTGYPNAFTPDGRRLLYDRLSDDTTPEIHIFEIGEEGSGQAWAEGVSGFNAQLSPDGRWLAYNGGFGARAAVFVRSFPTGDSRWQVATRGFEPRWAADGKSLYYRLDDKLWRVPVQFGESVSIGVAEQLLDLVGPNDLSAATYDFGPDGSLWVVRLPVTETSQTRVDLVLGWRP